MDHIKRLNSPSVSAISSASLDSFRDPPVTCRRTKQERKKLLKNQIKQETAKRPATGGHYNDAVDAGGPGARQHGRDVSGVALLAVVDALEHAIFTAAAADSAADATRKRK